MIGNRITIEQYMNWKRNPVKFAEDCLSLKLTLYQKLFLYCLAKKQIRRYK